MANSISSLLNKLTAGKAHARGLHGAVAELLDAHRAGQGHREQLINALPKGEVLKRAIAAEVDALAARGRTAHGPALARAAAGRLDLAPDHSIRGVVPGSVASWLTWPMDFETVCWLMPEAVKASLVATVATAEALETGPPLEERPGLIAAIDASLRELEAQHAQLVDAAAADGITIPHLPEESARRQRERDHADFAARNNAANADQIKRGLVEPMR